MIKFRKKMDIAQDDEGVTVIEFAFVAPIFLMIMMGGFDIAHTLYMRSVLNGALAKAARDSALQAGTSEQNQERINKYVESQMYFLAGDEKDVKVTFAPREFFADFASAANPKPEQLVSDLDKNGECDEGDSYVDENRNGDYDEDGIGDGQGGARDAVVYRVEVKYNRLFPMYGLLGWSKQITMNGSTVLANQPYSGRLAPPTRQC